MDDDIDIIFSVAKYLHLNMKSYTLRTDTFTLNFNLHQVDIAMAADELREAYGNDKKGSAMLTPRLSGNLPDLVARIFKTVRAEDS